MVEFWSTTTQKTRRLKPLSLGLLFTSLFLLSFSWKLSSQAYHYNFNEACKSAYEDILALRLEKGGAILDKERLADPKNLAPVFIENYIDFVVLFVSEDLKLFEELKDNKSIREELLKKGPQDSPWYNYCLGEMNLQWGIARSKFEDYLTGFREVKRAHKFLKTNQAAFPNFEPNNKSLGLMEIMVGTLPDKYQWGAKLLGFSGNLEAGFKKLEDLQAFGKSNDYFFKAENDWLYLFTILHLKKDNQEAWRLVQNNFLPYTDHLFNLFLCSNVAMNVGQNDKAIKMLSEHRKEEGFLPFHFLDYNLGLAKLRRLDKDALTHFVSYNINFQGKNFLKDSYQKIAWHHLVHGNVPGYKKALGGVAMVGQDEVDSDKQATKELESEEIPNALLLKARLLSDGGYYSRAIALLDGKKKQDFNRLRDRIEFTYRAGRIYHSWGKPDEAIGFYYSAILDGSETNYYFAASAYFNLALIHEKKGEKAKAEEYFKECIKMKKHPYANSLQQKSRAGLNRLKG